MQKLLFLSLATLISFTSLSAQKFFTKEGNIKFTSEAPLETIEAENKTTTCVLDTESGAVQLAALIKAFHFEKALMEEHFNENYMESDDYPKAVFKGTITNLADISLSENGEYDAEISGSLTMHGETNEVESTAKIIITDDLISATTTFEVLLEDYKVEIPSVVKDNISKTVAIAVEVDLQPLKK